MLWTKALGHVHNPKPANITFGVISGKSYEPLDGAKLTGKCINLRINYRYATFSQGCITLNDTSDKILDY
jgi:hypothetical protein